jgi:hypothetical protein
LSTTPAAPIEQLKPSWSESANLLVDRMGQMQDSRRRRFAARQRRERVRIEGVTDSMW